MTPLNLTSSVSDSVGFSLDRMASGNTGEDRGDWSILEEHTRFLNPSDHTDLQLLCPCLLAGGAVSGPYLPCQVINDLQRNTYRYE